MGDEGIPEIHDGLVSNGLLLVLAWPEDGDLSLAFLIDFTAHSFVASKGAKPQCCSTDGICTAA
jgi:hypothetical protein